MASIFWLNVIVSLCILSSGITATRSSDEIVFHFNNTYKYNVPYVVDVDRYTEYIMEFAGDSIYASFDPPASPARVTVASDFANRTYPLFVTARQQKGVFSWQLPMLVQTPMNTEQFTNISRTLCPHNNAFVENEDYCELSNLSTPIVHLSSASPDPIRVTILVGTVHDFYVKLNTTTNLTVTPSQPKYYFYPFVQGPKMDLTAQGLNKKYKCHIPLEDDEKAKVHKYFVESNALRATSWLSWFSRPKSVIIMIESDNDVCAVVSIQNFSCPVFDNERDILYDGYYLTMTRRGGITLTQDTFPMGFYIVFIVKSSDEDCLSVYHEVTNSTNTNRSDDGRVKNFSFRVIETISYQEYLVACGAALGCFLSFYVGFVIVMIANRAKGREVLLVHQNSEEGTSTPPLQDAQNDLDQLVNTARRRNVTSSGNSGRQSRDGDTTRDDSSGSDTDTEYSTVVTNIENDLYRPGARLCVANLSRCRPRVLSARSRMYLWNVLTVAVFYTLPVIQLVITYQRLLNQSGNQDLCYFNFLCAHPLLMLSDFNHVYSNLGYVLLGALFLAQVYRRHRATADMTVRSKELGIPQHFGLLYAMGIALVSEGLLSAAYHVCPNSMNFQFDTSFMYVTSVLCMVKIYQSRHPDVNARAHATFSVLALIIFIGLVGVLNANLYFWILFTILHLTTCLVITFQIYYLGRFRFDGAVVMRAVRELARRPVAAITPTHAGRCILLLIANLANWALAAYGMSQHSRDFASHLLLVLMSNLFLYTLFYIVMKLLHRETITWYSWIFIALTYTIWFSSSYFYLDQSTNWALTPAQSRQSNRQCSLLQLYDSHDIWHFMSSVAMFFSFNMYLTIDDNLSNVPRNEIMVF